MTDTTTSPIQLDPLLPGRVLAGGRYIVDRALSTGGMGALVVALDTARGDRPVVVKGLLPYFDASDPRAAAAAVARLRREAAILAAVQHPAVPQLIDLVSEGGCPYVVMQFLDGRNLLQGLSRPDAPGHAVGRPDALRWGVALAGALAALHAHPGGPILHQDVKPENIVVDRAAGQIWLVDFGSARVAGDGWRREPGGTAPPSVYGTPGYAPPEQYHGATEPRSDVYALAATLYHLLTNDDPTAHPQTFPLLRPLGALGRLLAEALDPDPARRPDAAELRARLHELAHGEDTIRAPDGTPVDDPAALVRWCEQHWDMAARWLAGGLPEQITLWWGDAALGGALRKTVTRSGSPQVALDQALALIAPRRHAEQRHELAVSDQAVYFGSVASRGRATRTVQVRNTGQRTTVARVSAPPWLTAHPALMTLAPGQAATLTLTVAGVALRRTERRDGIVEIEAAGVAPIELPARAWMVRWIGPPAWALRPLAWLPRLLVLILALAIAVPIGTASYARGQHLAAAQAAFRRSAWDEVRVELVTLGDAPDAVALRQASYERSALDAIRRADWERAAADITTLDGMRLDSVRGDLPYYLGASAELRAALARQRLAGWQDGEIHRIHTRSPAGAPSSIAVSANDRWLLVGVGGASPALALWDLSSGMAGPTLPLLDPPQQVAFVSQSPLVVAAVLGGPAPMVMAWQFDGRSFRTVTSAAGRAGALSPDGTAIAATTADGVAQLTTGVDAAPPIVLQTGGREVRAWRWSGDGAVLAGAAQDGSLLLWRLPDPAPALVVAGDGDAGEAWSGQTLAFSPDGVQVAMRTSDGVGVWRVADSAALRRFVTDGRVNGLAWSPDGSVLATVSTAPARRRSGDAGVLQLWNMATGASAWSGAAGDADTVDVAWTSDGRTLLVAGTRTVELWRP